MLGRQIFQNNYLLDNLLRIYKRVRLSFEKNIQKTLFK